MVEAARQNARVHSGDLAKPFHSQMNFWVAKLFSAAAFCVGTLTIPASAAFIAEMEANDTLATAQNVNAGFGLGANVDIGSHFGIDPSVTPNVSIRATGDGTHDYYAFNVPITGSVSLDIDYGRPTWDPWIALWKALGGGLFELIVQRDDGQLVFDAATSLPVSENQDVVDPGSAEPVFIDPSIHVLNLSAGNYVVGVARFFSSVDNTGWTGAAPEQGDSYTLHITRPVGTVPDAGSTLLLLGAGIAALSTLRRQAK